MSENIFSRIVERTENVFQCFNCSQFYKLNDVVVGTMYDICLTCDTAVKLSINNSILTQKFLLTHCITKDTIHYANNTHDSYKYPQTNNGISHNSKTISPIGINTMNIDIRRDSLLHLSDDGKV